MNTDLHRMLVCSDFSAPARHALDRGAQLAQVQLYRDQMRYEAQAQLARLAQQAGLVTGSWVPLVVNGYAPAHVLEQEEEQDVDLIVLGKHGQGMIESLLLGSTTKHVLSASRCDVLVTQRS